MGIIKAILEVWKEQKNTNVFDGSHYFRVFDHEGRMITSFNRNPQSEFGALRFNLKYTWHCEVLTINQLLKNKKYEIICYDYNNKMNRIFIAESW